MGEKYVEGYFRFNQMQLYVNRGIGTVGLPFRFDCPPEITVITLQPA
jgi:predicted MPP superfamily phosphohydrolase